MLLVQLVLRMVVVSILVLNALLLLFLVLVLLMLLMRHIIWSVLNRDYVYQAVRNVFGASLTAMATAARRGCRLTRDTLALTLGSKLEGLMLYCARGLGPGLGTWSDAVLADVQLLLMLCRLPQAVCSPAAPRQPSWTWNERDVAWRWRLRKSNQSS